jgi:hypothetical protein
MMWSDLAWPVGGRHWNKLASSQPQRAEEVLRAVQKYLALTG